MDDGICAEQFPKELKHETEHDNAQFYIAYRWRASDSGGKTAPWTYTQVGEPSKTGTIDIGWVVPYYSPTINDVSASFER